MGGGNRVSKLFLQRTQIRKIFFFFFFFGGGGGGVGGARVSDFFTKNPNQKEIGGGKGKGARANEFLLLRIKI